MAGLGGSLPSATAGVAEVTLSLNSSIGTSTTRLSTSGEECGISEAVDLAFDGTVISHARTDGTGSFTQPVTIPGTAVQGNHMLIATGESSRTVALAEFLGQTDWAQFHFDAAKDGVNPYENVLSPATVGGLQVKWTYQADAESVGNPAVVGGVVYFGDFAGTVHAVDAVTGNRIWSHPGLGDWAIDPAVANGAVYVVTGGGDSVVALEAATGKFLWARATHGGVFGAPAIANGLIYAASNDGHLYALDLATGAVQWKAPTSSTSEVVTVADGLVYLGGLSVNFQAFDALTGRPVWSDRLRGYPAGSAVVDGVAYVGTSGAPPYKLYALDAATGAPIWVRTIPDTAITHGIMDTPAVVDGIVYVGTQDGYLYAVDAATGTFRWRFQTGDSFFLASPVVANGVVYTGSKAGTIFALDARTGTQLWSYGTGGGINGAPAITDGVVYVASFDKELYAFGLP
jgi:outer membrane protein assembly factor BamB